MASTRVASTCSSDITSASIGPGRPMMRASRRRTVRSVPDAETQSAAADQLLVQLQTLYCNGELTAKSLCTLSHTAWAAGA
eukprot:1882635-Pyramimonas_sp.AAC.1